MAENEVQLYSLVAVDLWLDGMLHTQECAYVTSIHQH